MNLRSLVRVTQVHEAMFFLFFFIPSVCFFLSLDRIISVVYLPVHWCFPPLRFFYFGYCIFQLQNFHLVSLYHFCFLAWFFLWLQAVVIPHWSSFLLAALKSLSDHFNISVISVLASIDSLFSFIWDLPGSWYDEWVSIKTWTVYVTCETLDLI